MLPFVLYSLGFIMIGLSYFVWHARRSPINSAFSGFTVSIAIWIISIAFIHSSNNVEPWVRLSFAGASFIPCTFVAFARVYPNVSTWPTATTARLALVLGGVFASLALFTDLIVHDAVKVSGVLTRQPGMLYYGFALYFVVVWMAALAVLLGKWKRASGLNRLQLRYLGTGITILGVGGITANLIYPMLTGKSTYVWMGPCFAFAFVAFVTHAIIRHSLMELRFVVHRGLTIGLATIISLVPVCIFLAAFWPKLLSHLDSQDSIIVLTAMTIVVLMVSLTRDYAGTLLDRYVYRSHTNYQETVRNSSKRLTQVLNLASLQDFMAHTVQSSIHAAGAAVYVKSDDGFVRTVFKAQTSFHSFDAPLKLDERSLGDLITFGDGPLVLDALRKPETSAAFEEFRSFNWSLLLPLLSENVVIGLIAVGPKLSGDPFYPQDVDLLTTLANQAGIALKNAQLYGQVALANEYIENIVASIDSGVVAVNALGQVTMFNRAAELLTGMAAEQIRGADVSLLPGCLRETLLGTIRERAKQTLPEIDLADGTVTRPVICTTSPLRDPGGTPLGAVAVFSDLTPLKELERQRRRAERLAYFEVLASAIAHEIKNPLVAIKAFAQLVPRRRDNEAFLENFGRVVTREIARMERLVERLRTLSRPANRPHHPVDVRMPVREVLELLQPSFEQKRIAVTVALGDEPAVVSGDDSELGELFMNLLMNAQEATPLDGRLTIDLTTTPTRVTITIADTGPGIPDELLERIFEPFVTTKQQGSGLGLAICMGIAEAHDAKLRVANQVTGGAVFTVELPVAVPSTAGAPA